VKKLYLAPEFSITTLKIKKGMKKVLTALVILSVCFAGCKKDDDDSDAQTMTCKIDGVDWTAKSFTNSLIIGYDASMNAEGKRMDLRGTDAAGRMIILSIGDASGSTGDGVRTVAYNGFDDVNDCTTQNGSTICSGSLFTYMLTYTDFYMGPDEGSIVVTSCDETKHTASGTFHYKAVNFDSGDTINVTNGVFSNLRYSVSHQ
jgi:hypothetical protein